MQDIVLRGLGCPSPPLATWTIAEPRRSDVPGIHNSECGLGFLSVWSSLGAVNYNAMTAATLRRRQPERHRGETAAANREMWCRMENIQIKSRVVVDCVLILADTIN